MHQLSLELHRHQICGHTQKRKLAALSYNMWMSSSSHQVIKKTFLNGQGSYSVSYEKLDTKYPKRRLKFAKTKSNIWDFIPPYPAET
jgi:hypothetical protein